MHVWDYIPPISACGYFPQRCWLRRIIHPQVCNGLILHTSNLWCMVSSFNNYSILYTRSPEIKYTHNSYCTICIVSCRTWRDNELHTKCTTSVSRIISRWNVLTLQKWLAFFFLLCCCCCLWSNERQLQEYTWPLCHYTTHNWPTQHSTAVETILQ